MSSREQSGSDDLNQKVCQHKRSEEDYDHARQLDTYTLCVSCGSGRSKVDKCSSCGGNITPPQVSRKPSRKFVDSGTRHDRKFVESGSRHDRKFVESGSRHDRKFVESGSRHDRNRFESGSRHDRNFFESGSRHDRNYSPGSRDSSRNARTQTQQSKPMLCFTPSFMKKIILDDFGDPKVRKTQSDPCAHKKSSRSIPRRYDDDPKCPTCAAQTKPQPLPRKCKLCGDEFLERRSMTKFCTEEVPQQPPTCGGPESQKCNCIKDNKQPPAPRREVQESPHCSTCTKGLPVTQRYSPANFNIFSKLSNTSTCTKYPAPEKKSCLCQGPANNATPEKPKCDCRKDTKITKCSHCGK